MPICVESICASDVTSSTPTIAAIFGVTAEITGWNDWNVIEVKRFRRSGIGSEILGLHRYFGAAV
jgi:hypothetical protein